jgi:hypothetical protein
MARLERAGIIRRVGGGRLDEILRVPPPSPKPGGDIVLALIEERLTAR